MQNYGASEVTSGGAVALYASGERKRNESQRNIPAIMSNIHASPTSLIWFIYQNSRSRVDFECENLMEFEFDAEDDWRIARVLPVGLADGKTNKAERSRDFSCKLMHNLVR